MPYIITVFISALVAFGAAWQVQDWRQAAREKQHETEQIAQLNARRVADTARLANLNSLQKAAEARALALRNLASNARRESDGLRGALVTLSRQPATDTATSNQRATAVGELLAECSDQYQTLAATADRHASDVQTLSDAWPD